MPNRYAKDALGEMAPTQLVISQQHAELTAEAETVTQT